MKRKIMQFLLDWKRSNQHLPLMLRGARQVGKSHLVQAFGQQCFGNCVTINFERFPQYKTCFDSNDPHKICAELELLTSQRILPGETLLFLDEIQECPRAIEALRYFKEEMPALHVIGAGSLLEFVIADHDFSMPVGRVQFLYLMPLSFEEFLWSLGEETLADYLYGHNPEKPLTQAVHEKLLELARLYFILGGMPAVVQTYLDSRSIEKARQMQSSLLEVYRADFGKYGKRQEFEHLQTMFEKLPLFATQQLKYSKIDGETESRKLKAVLEKLVKAELVHRVFHSSASGVPLSATVNERKFKTVFLDVGLLLRAHHVDPQYLVSDKVLFLLQGAMMEQFVGQELLAYQDPYGRPELFFWSREQKSSEAEVDYLITLGERIIPIEVKSKSLGHLKSLKQFMHEKNSFLGVRISEHPFSLKENILSIPLYGVFALTHYLANLDR